MGMDAGIKVTFYDADGKKIQSTYLDCYEGQVKCEKHKIPENATSVKTCFTTEYENCDECLYLDNENSSESTFYSDCDEEEEEDDYNDESEEQKLKKKNFDFSNKQENV